MTEDTKKAALLNIASNFKGWEVEEQYDIAPNGEIVLVNYLIGKTSKHTGIINAEAGLLRSMLNSCGIPHKAESSWITVNHLAFDHCVCCDS